MSQDALNNLNLNHNRFNNYSDQPTCGPNRAPPLLSWPGHPCSITKKHTYESDGWNSAVLHLMFTDEMMCLCCLAHLTSFALALMT
jgi:hypothetical protein